MPGKGIEITGQRLDIDRPVRHGLGAVNQDLRASGMGLVNDGFNRIDRAERVGDMTHGDQPRLVAQQPVIFGEY